MKRELVIFTLVGFLSVLLDFWVYRGLSSFHVLGTEFAKGIGFATGTLFAYFANQYWTFACTQHPSDKVGRFILLYIITGITNVLINLGALIVLNKITFAVQLAFCIATGVSASLNFVGMKWFVFHSEEIIEKSI